MTDESDPLTPRASTPPPGFSGVQPSAGRPPTSPITTSPPSISGGPPEAKPGIGHGGGRSEPASTIQLTSDSWAGLLAVALIAFGSFGPWAHAAGASVSALGHGGNAIYTLIAGVVLLVPAIRGIYPGLAIAAGLVVAGIAYRDGLQISSLGDGFVEVGLGWGIIATGIGGLLAIGWGARRLVLAQARTDE